VQKNSAEVWNADASEFADFFADVKDRLSFFAGLKID